MIEIKENEKIFRNNKLLDITAYYDAQHLSFDKFMRKYGYVGLGINNPTEIRFRTHDFAFKEVMKILEENISYYFIPVVGNTPKVYKGEKHEINAFLYENVNDDHFIIMDVKIEWILIKTNYNKVIGLGDLIKNKIKSIAAGIDMKTVMFLLNC